MQKVYLLLRNNQQTGPHSLDELLQLGLKPFDLIWVEGKSFGWSYPSEIETLRSFAPAAPQKAEPVPPVAAESSLSQPIQQIAAPKHIFVSMPGSVAQASVPTPAYDPIEQKAEELRKRAQLYSTQSTLQPEEFKTNYARSLNSVEEDYTSWLYEKKTRKKTSFPTTPLLKIGLIGAGLFGLWWMAKSVFSTSGDLTSRAATYTSAKPEGVQTVTATTETEEQPPIKEEPIAKERVHLKHTTASTTVKKVKENSQSHKGQSLTASTGTAPVIATKEPVPPPQEPAISTTDKNEAPAAEPSKTKKKSLKEVLGGLFKKKKEEPVQQEPQPASTNGNERTATRRDETAASSTVNIADQVDIKMNKNSDDWMMGVEGLKLTLYNRSTVTLNKATVEVLYYSEQNSLLDKKILYFSNIASQKSQTLPAPDHRTADHVEYRVVSATGS